MNRQKSIDRKTGKEEQARFLREHPWEEKYLNAAAPVEYFFSYSLDASPYELWPILSDTSGINEKIGLSGIDYREERGIRYGRSRIAGCLHEWEERPWQWEHGSSILIERIYSKGWCSYVRVIIIIEKKSEGGSDLTVNFGWIPRNKFSALLLILGRGSMRKKYGAAIAAILEDSRKVNPGFFLMDAADRLSAAAPLSSKTDIRKIDAISAKLKERGIPEHALSRFTGHVISAPASELHRIKPKPLARALSLDYNVLLNLMLNATAEGLLKMSWDVVCPHCRGVRKSADHLWDIPKKGECEVCSIDFETSDINALEITFQPNPDIKKSEETLFCSAEPAKKSHILMQLYLFPGENRTSILSYPEGRYRMRLLGSSKFSILDLTSSADLKDLYWNHQTEGGGFTTAPGASLRMTNGDTGAKTFIIEKNSEDRDALRPRDLFSMQEFRDLFAEEALAVNLSIDVGVQTLAFIDIVGSSAMYIREGNARAFALVSEFFKKSREIAVKREGAIVKSMGDAVLLAFTDPLNALMASLDFIRKFDGTDREIPVEVRVTVNSGPCMAVNLNSAIDYFGSPVNTAAKLQKFAGAGDAAVTSTVVSDPGVRAYLEQKGFNLSRSKTADLPGIGDIEYWILRARKKNSPNPPHTF
jgi:class 3 adenylate cyclase